MKHLSLFLVMLFSCAHIEEEPGLPTEFLDRPIQFVCSEYANVDSMMECLAYFERGGRVKQLQFLCPEGYVWNLPEVCVPFLE